MATLQKFKLLATQCAVVAGSPTRSPTASPVIHLRRRKTLRMFLSRPDRRRLPSRGIADDQSADDDDDGDEHDEDSSDAPEKSAAEARVRRKLKDLFVSSSPPPQPVDDGRGRELEGGEERRGLLYRRGVGVSFRPLTASFRCRLLRRAWRPVLVSIPE